MYIQCVCVRIFWWFVSPYLNLHISSPHMFRDLMLLQSNHPTFLVARSTKTWIHPFRMSRSRKCLPCGCLSPVVLRCVCRRWRVKKIWKKGVLAEGFQDICVVGDEVFGKVRAMFLLFLSVSWFCFFVWFHVSYVVMSISLCVLYEFVFFG